MSSTPTSSDPRPTDAEAARIACWLPGGAANLEAVEPVSATEQALLIDAERHGPLHPSWVLTVDDEQAARRLLRRLEALVALQPALRASFHLTGLERPWKAIARRVDLTPMLPDPGVDAVGAVAAALRAPIAPDRAPLLRAAIAPDPAAGRWLFGLAMHHAIVDHGSAAALLRVAAAGDTTPLPPPATAPARRPCAAGDDAAGWLRSRFAGCEAPAVPWPLSASAAAAAAAPVRRAERRLDGARRDALRRAAARLRVVPAALFHAAWALLQTRATGRSDALFGSVFSTRAPGDRRIGAFVRTLPLRLRPAGGARAWVRAVHEELAWLLAHRDLPLAAWHAASGIAAPRSLHAALLNCRLQAMPGEAPAVVHVDEPVAEPLAAMVDDLGIGYRLAVQTRGGADPAAIAAMFDAALAGLVAALDGPDDPPVDAIEVLPAEQRARLAAWADGGPAHDAEWPVTARHARQAARTPQAIAVCAGTQALDHAALERRVQALAGGLRRRGVGRGSRVAIDLPRGIDWVVAVVATMRAAAAAMPLDPELPSGRRAEMLADAKPACVLDAAALAATEALPAPAGGLPAVGLDDIAYVLYTSGSRGRPKGVAMPHRALANLLAAEHAGGGGQRTAQFAAPGFDVAMQELWGALAYGGTLVVAPDAVRRDPARLVAFAAAERIERLYLPTVMLARFAEAFAAAGSPALALADLACAGEALHLAPPVARALARLPGCRLHNQYGPTETHVVTWDTLALAGAVLPERPAIGRPIAGVQVHLLDAQGRPVPPGATGEICVAGAALAAGYVGEGDAGSARFVDGGPLGRLYRTGDLGRWRDDGRIDFLGRADLQVKIRGHRVEPGEVEARLAALAGVREAAVAVRARAAGEPALLAWVVVDPACWPGAEAARAALAEVLPEPMRPSAIMPVPRLPLTPNGKRDLAALPDPAHAPAGGDAPSGPCETGLAAIWSELLGVGPVGREADFFALGGHSLLATQVVSRVRARFGVELPLALLFDEPTLAGQARAIAERAAADGPAPPCASALAAPIPPAGRDGAALPASDSQRRMWLVQQLDPQTTAYNVPFVVRLVGALDAGRLARAIATVVARHEAFRTRLRMAGGQLVQVIDRPAPPRVAELRLAPGELLAPVLAALADERFDLAQGPLYRITLVRPPDGPAVLVWLMHHAIADQWSGGVLLRELDEAWRADAEGRAPCFAPRTIEVADHAAWQQAPAQRHAVALQLGHWRERLRDLPPLQLPVDTPRRSLPSGRGGTIERPLGAARLDRLRRFSAAAGVTPFMTLLAAFKVLLARDGRQTDIAVGTPIANRQRIELEPLVGTLVNTLVMRTDLAGAPSFCELLQRVKATALDAYAHQDVPFERLVEVLAGPRDPTLPPLVRVLFNVVNAPVGAARIGDLRIEAQPFERRAAQFDLSLTADTELFGRLQLEYAADLFREDSAARIADRYLALLDALLAAPDRSIADPELSGPADAALEAQWHRPAAEAPLRWPRVDAWIAATAALAGERTALEAGGTRLSHAALGAEANHLARQLRARGIGRGDRVGLALARGAGLVIAQLAVLRAGAAWVPLDPGDPPARRRQIAERAGLALMVSDGECGGLAALAVPRLVVALPAGIGPGQPGSAPLAADPARDAGPEDPAYVMHTSGSTGQPKGVAVPHRAVLRLFEAMAAEPGLAPGDRLLAVTTAGFDISVLELLLPLAVGATVVIADRDDVRDGAALAARIAADRITVMQATPSLWRLLVASGWRGQPGLRALVGGEALAPDLAEALCARAGEVWNMYGPTETTVWSTCARIAAGDAVTIGRPIAGTTVTVHDDRGLRCPVGVAGELWIGGAGVAIGYLGAPALTAERFVAAADGSRCYRTGDLGRWRADGRLEHLGRIDDQVKLRGHRIEPGEIEARLRRHAGIAEAAVVLQAPAGAEPRLVAFLVAAPGSAPQPPDALRRHLREALPEAMVPAGFAWLPALPRLPNGKLDRRALPDATDTADVAAARPADPADGHAMPAGATEKRLAAIWRRALGQDGVRRDDNFFDLGGHSMLAMQVAGEIREQLGAAVSLRQMIHETLAQTAADCDRQAGGERVAA